MSEQEIVNSDKNLLERYIDLAQQKPRVGILMSGEGSNAINILAQRDRYPNLGFVCIVTDNSKSNARVISEQFGLRFHETKWNRSLNSPRKQLFSNITQFLEAECIDILVYAGFMRIAPGDFVRSLPGINIHPSDLSLKADDGTPRYTGMQALGDAVTAGERFVHSSVHIVDESMDCGDVIAISDPLLVEPRDRNDIMGLHSRLKVNRELKLYPEVLEKLSKGLISIDDVPLRGNMKYYD